MEKRLEDLNWDDFLTPQEDSLRGAGINPKYKNRWYTPYLVQDGCNPTAVDQIRQQFKTYWTGSAFWVDGKGKNPQEEVETTFSPLNLETGETIHDPGALDEKLEINPDTEAYHRLRT